MIGVMKNVFGIVGLVLAVTYTIDLFFYWTSSGYDILYLTKLVVYIIACSSVFWIFFLKNELKKSQS